MCCANASIVEHWQETQELEDESKQSDHNVQIVVLLLLDIGGVVSIDPCKNQEDNGDNPNTHVPIGPHGFSGRHTQVHSCKNVHFVFLFL